MKVNSLLLVLLSTCISIAVASANNKFQVQKATSSETNTASGTLYLVQNAAITLNPKIDEIQSSDPRLKTVIDYATREDSRVSIVFYNPDNLRFARRLYKVLASHDLRVESPALSTTKNMLEINLIKIYLDLGEQYGKQNQQSIINQTNGIIRSGNYN